MPSTHPSPFISGKAVQMKKMEDERRRRNAWPRPGTTMSAMRAKMNRYDLSLWDVGKRSLYGRERESVQAATLAGGFMERDLADSTSTKTE